MTSTHEADALPLNGKARMPVDYRAIFSQRLFALRTRKKQVSQAEVARNTGISKDMIHKYELGKTNPGPDKIAKLAAYFDVEPSELMPTRLDEKRVEVEPEYYVRLTAGENDPRLSIIEIRQNVRTSTALKIMQLLEEDRIEKHNDNDGRASN
jgi:transcriptional regulator with XRE-family HTH domain